MRRDRTSLTGGPLRAPALPAQSLGGGSEGAVEAPFDETAWRSIRPTPRSMPRASRSTRWCKRSRRSAMAPATLKKILLPLLGLGGVLVVWTVISQTIAHDLPSPLRTWNESRRYVLEPFFKDGEMNQGMGRLASYSLLRVGKGYLLALAIGTPIGFLLGLSRSFHAAFDPIVQFLR